MSLLVFQCLGWKGRFCPAHDWQERFAEAGLRVEQAASVGSQGGRRFFPGNVVFVLRAAD